MATSNEKINLLRDDYRRLERKYHELRSAFDLLAEKIEPMVIEYYRLNQPQTPRGHVKRVYRNDNKPQTHGFYIVKIVFESNEGIDEASLKDEVKIALTRDKKPFNPSAFSRCLNDNIRKGVVGKSNDGIYYYIS